MACKGSLAANLLVEVVRRTRSCWIQASKPDDGPRMVPHAQDWVRI